MVSRWFQGWFHANDVIANGIWISRISRTQTETDADHINDRKKKKSVIKIRTSSSNRCCRLQILLVVRSEVCFQNASERMCARVSRWFQGRFHANDDIANGVWILGAACAQTETDADHHNDTKKRRSIIMIRRNSSNCCCRTTIMNLERDLVFIIIGAHLR